MNTPTFALPDAIAVSLDIVSKESLAEKITSVDFIGVLLFKIDERIDQRAPNIKQIYIKDKRMKKQEVED